MIAPAEIAQIILQGFDAYLSAFKAVTAQASQRFAERDWHGIQADSAKRLSIYKSKVPRVARQVKRSMGPEFDSWTYWRAIKEAYLPLALSRHHYEIAQTYFNSVCRKVLGNLGAADQLMFVRDELQVREYLEAPPTYRRHLTSRPWADIMREVLQNHAVQAPFEDLERDVNHLVERLEQEVLPSIHSEQVAYFDVLQPNFYRNKAAYIVGRLVLKDRIVPFVVSMLNRSKGVFADALLTDENELSIIFSYTRSYFLVEIDIPSEVVQFLRSLLPRKPYGDIYNSIGFNKHGKTELYRDFLRHLENSTDQFVVAPGIRGMVMAVFTLPSYSIVFKLIKDHFDPPKVTDRGKVRSRYKLVSRHDRVGRMADTHEFLYFTLPKDRFHPDLLAELLRVAPSLIQIQEEQVIIQHLYTERKMIPLNMYLETANKADAEEVADEYGNTIKQLAAANIFPGDMLLKNFGVTRHKRVVFYDYDEIGFLTDYHFRKMPEPQGMDDVYAAAPWFGVGPKDVFPQEFRHFLIGTENMRERFYAKHSDLFEVDFWLQMQEKQRSGEILDVYPYRRRRRFAERLEENPDDSPPEA